MAVFDPNSTPSVSNDADWTVDSLKSRVALFETPQYAWERLEGNLGALRRAAVLVPLVIERGQVHVWLTKRSDQVGHDKGHVSFPGGMRDPTDLTAVDTALREASEEIDLRPCDLVAILGQTPPRISIRGILVTPVVAVVTPEFRPAPNAEVAFAFRRPLARFLSSHDHWRQIVNSPVSPDKRGYLHFFRDVEEGGVGGTHGSEGQADHQSREAITFGLTAGLLTSVACAILGRAPDFEYDLSQPMEPSDPFRSAIWFLEQLSAPSNNVLTDLQAYVAKQSRL